MSTPLDVDRQGNSELEEIKKESVGEPKENPKVTAQPFIIYSESNEEFVIDEDEPVSMVRFDHGPATEEKGKRRNKRNKNKGKKGLRQQLESMDSLVLPDGVKLVEDGSYIGFQCTYCNCVMSSLKTVEEHTGGNPHKQKLRSKAAKGEDATVTDTENQLTDPQPLPSNASSTDVLNSDSSTSASDSALNKFLSKAKEPIVGLDHVVEVQLQDMPPMYRCNLCIVDLDNNGIKDHITGMRHRLSYLRLMDTQKVAEMLALNLKKPERNKRTIKYIEELHAVYGSGTIKVTNMPLPPITVAIESETKASAQPHAAVQPGNNPPIIIWTEPKTPQKRPSEGGYPPWKRQSRGRGFQGWRRFNNRRQRGNFFGRRNYQERESHYPGQHLDERPSDREEHGNTAYQRDSCQVEKDNAVEENTNMPQGKHEHQTEINKEQDEKRFQQPNKEHENKPSERHDQNIDKGRGEIWRSYSDVNYENSRENKSHSRKQQLVNENPQGKSFENNARNPVSQKGYEPIPPPPPPPDNMKLISRYEDTGENDGMNNRGRGQGRGRRGRFGTRNRGAPFSTSAMNRFQSPSRFEGGTSSFNRFGDFGRLSSFRNIVNDPLSIERDRLKMKYPGLRLGR